jgi:hypothetical protein
MLVRVDMTQSPNKVGETSGRRRPLVIAGIPRSGTTWTLEALECDDTLYSLSEPDSEGSRSSAIWAKRHTGRLPVLAPGERNDPYHLLWAWILAGATETPRLRVAGQMLRLMSPLAKATGLRAIPTLECKRYLRGGFSPAMSLAGVIANHPPVCRNPILDDHRLLVKTVHAPLAMDWLATEFEIDVLVLLRHPGSVLASWIALDMNAQYVPFAGTPSVQHVAETWGVQLPGSDHLERIIWQIGMLITALEQAAAHHPDWVIRTHEQMCRNPVEEFHRLYSDLGLHWNEKAKNFLVKSDRPGTGFRTRRLTAELPDNWKQRLTPHQLAELQRVLAWFPLTTWSAEDFELASGE